MSATFCLEGKPLVRIASLQAQIKPGASKQQSINTIYLSCLLHTENLMKAQNLTTLLLSLLTCVPLTFHKDTLPNLVNHNSKECQRRNVIFCSYVSIAFILVWYTMKAMETNSSTTFSQVAHKLRIHTLYKALMPLNSTYFIKNVFHFEIRWGSGHDWLKHHFRLFLI
jgi:hypothetical protein